MHILFSSFNGYRSVSSFLELNENDVLQIEIYSQRLPQILQENLASQKSGNKNAKLSKMLKYFFGIYSVGFSFQFPPGDKRLLLSISPLVNANTEIFEDSSECDLCAVETTMFGKLFCDNPAKHPNKRKKSEITRNESPVLAQSYDADSINTLSDYLKAGLIEKLKEHGEKTSQANTEDQSTVSHPKVMDIDHSSLIRQLQYSGILASKEISPNGTQQFTSATLKCFCSDARSNVKVYFRFKESTRDNILKILNARTDAENTIKENESNAITVHFGNCWSLSNLVAHNKARHLKRKDLNSEFIFLNFAVQKYIDKIQENLFISVDRSMVNADTMSPTVTSVTDRSGNYLYLCSN